MEFLKDIEWKITIGDPTFMGWLTVALYFFAAFLALRVMVSSEILFVGDNEKLQKQFWLFVTLILLFLGINKQLDLQSLLTAIGRYSAHRDGWYENRRFISTVVIVAILSILSIAMMLFIHRMKPILKTNLPAIIGLCFLLLFVIIRATSFHHMGLLVSKKIWGIRMYLALEQIGILAIIFSAITLFRNKEQTPQ